MAPASHLRKLTSTVKHNSHIISHPNPSLQQPLSDKEKYNKIQSTYKPNMPHVNSKHDTHELRIASWNVRSLTLNKPKQLAALAGACGLDFIIIQELLRDDK